jgi:hypothetical protein
MNDLGRLKLIRERLEGHFDLQKIVLFGSRARGDARPDSDYDVLVIAKTDVPFIDRQGMGLMALGNRDFSLDLLIYTPEEAEAAQSIPGSALYWAEREGRVMYAK